MPLIYDRTMLLNAAVDSTKYPNLATQINVQDTLNNAVRDIHAEVDLRSTKRKATAIQLFDDEYDYTAPSDMKNWGLIDIIPQKPRLKSERYTVLYNEQFDRKKSTNDNLVTIFEADIARTLRFSGPVDDTPLTVSGLGSTTDGGGTWSAFGNASGVTADTTNYIQGGGSLSFDLTSGGTTAGIVNSTLTAIDISLYATDGAAFLWVYLTSTTDITNVILRIGSDSSNYHQMTETTQADGSAFVAGWNLVRFNFIDTTDTGTPVDTAADYVAMYLTKASGTTGNNFRFDWLRLHDGEYANVHYYSAFGWASTAAATTFKENSTTAADYVVAVTPDEIQLVVARCRIEIFRNLREYDQLKIEEINYYGASPQKPGLLYRFKRRNPSERMKFQYNYA